MDSSQCVHCGLCLTACPTYQTTGMEVESPRGRLVLLKEWAGNPEARDQETATWLDDCLDCRACEAICPAHVPTGHLIEEWRSQPNTPLQERPVTKWLTWFIASPRGLTWFRRLTRFAQSHPIPKWLPPGITHLQQGLPSISTTPISRHRIASDRRTDHTVMLFVGCVMDALYSTSNVHTADLLRLADYAVTVPQNQRCCGALHLHSGQPALARNWAKVNIKAYETSGAREIVVNAAGCGSTLKEYGQLFQDDPEWRVRAEQFSNAVRDITVLLDGAELPTLSPTGERITVHDACHHVHAQNITKEPRALLQQAGYTIVEMPDSTLCCGSAGVYNLTHPRMSQAILQQKLSNIPEDIDVVAAANPGCILQIQAGATTQGRHVTVSHPVDLIWKAYHDAQCLPQEEVSHGT